MPEKATRRVFVSYTGQDLSECADVVLKVLRNLQHVGIDHRDSGAIGQPSVQWCMEEVDKADLLVVLVAHRYGWVPSRDEGGDGRTSIVHLEVNRANAKKKIVLPYIVEEGSQWPTKYIEALTNPDVRENLEGFKGKLNKTVVHYFTNSASLEGPLSRDIAKAIERLEQRETSLPPPEEYNTLVGRKQKNAQGDMIDPKYLLERSAELFQQAKYGVGAEINQVIFDCLKCSKTEEGRVLAVRAAIYKAINLRNSGDMKTAWATLEEAEEIRESKEFFLEGQIQRVKGSILFERGKLSDSDIYIRSANEILTKPGVNELELMMNKWREVWSTYLQRNSVYKKRLKELEELYTSVEIGGASKIDKNFAKTIWVKTASGILIAEGKPQEAKDLIYPIIVEWDNGLEQNPYYQPTMIADFFRELADISYSLQDENRAIDYRKKCKNLLKGFRPPYFPFLSSEESMPWK